MTEIRAAGVVCVTPDGRVLLMRRAGNADHAGLWALPGGDVEGDETPQDAARRELAEQTCYAADGDLTPWTQGADFTTFLLQSKEFQPMLSEQHDSAQWIHPDFALSASALLHPSAPIALRRFENHSAKLDAILARMSALSNSTRTRPDHAEH